MATVQDITQKVLINAPIQKVWTFVSTPEGIASWFMPNDIDLKVGHEFHLQSPFGPSPCKVLEVNPPNKLSFTWDTEGWVVEFLLKEMGDQTEFTVIHSGWKDSEEIIGKAGEKAAIIRDRMNQGWSGIVARLEEVVS
ncbi:SRPBCC family protein [Fredinandcohnia humi]